MDRRDWQAAVYGFANESDTTEWLSNNKIVLIAIIWGEKEENRMGEMN